MTFCPRPSCSGCLDVGWFAQVVKQQCRSEFLMIHSIIHSSRPLGVVGATIKSRPFDRPFDDMILLRACMFLYVKMKMLMKNRQI